MSNFIPIDKKAQEAVVEFLSYVGDTYDSLRSSRQSQMEAIDKAYQRESDATAEHANAKQANRTGDTTKIQNVTVPVVMPQVETAVEYQADVFLSGHPIFPVVAAPKYMDAAMQMSSLIEDQSIKGGWAEQLIMFFRNCCKYNFGPIEVSWQDKILHAVETDVAYRGGQEGKPVELKWAGNVVKSLDPYNSFADPSVPASEVHTRGEFAGYTENISRLELVTKLRSLPRYLQSNWDDIFNSSTASVKSSSLGYYIPNINSSMWKDNELRERTDWTSWLTGQEHVKQLDYKGVYKWTVLYCRIIPKEFGITNVSAKSTPQIWKFYIVNFSVVAYAERVVDAHGYIPMLIGQPYKDNLSHQTKSLAENGLPFQEVSSALMNGTMASMRRAVNDRVLYDPSRVSAAHINSPNPSAKIPVRPAAFGSDIGRAVYQFPYREDQLSANMASISQLLSMANMLAGQNPARQGQFVKGNKTRDEFTEIMGNASGRDKLVSIALEAQVFTPMKTILKSNILQYQGGTEIYDRTAKQLVEIEPVKLRQAIMDFEVADGLTPTDKLISADTLAVAIQTMGSSPQVASSYNVGPAFSYLMKTKGADLAPFEKSQAQLAYEQALGIYQANVQAAIDKGIDPEKLGPQPTPDQFGYQPASNDPNNVNADAREVPTNE